MINLLRSDLLLTGCFSTENWALTQSPYWQLTDWLTIRSSGLISRAEPGTAWPGSGYGSRIPQTKKFTGTGEDRGGGWYQVLLVLVLVIVCTSTGDFLSFLYACESVWQDTDQWSLSWQGKKCPKLNFIVVAGSVHCLPAWSSQGNIL